MPVLTFFRSKSQLVSARAEAIYQRALRIVGIQDCPEAQITAAIAVCVALFYILVGLEYLFNLLSAQVAPVLTALLT